MRYDRTVLGYHGTDGATADRILAGEVFRSSGKDYDWLGGGVYFWEFGYDRAVRWAEDNYGEDPAVVGALIQLGQCYDLLDTRFTHDLAEGAERFMSSWASNADVAPPRNKGRGRKARYRDCAIINWWLEQLEGEGVRYQTVRCGFNEGDPVHDGMAILRESHVQIAVRDASSILGVFRPSSS